MNWFTGNCAGGAVTGLVVANEEGIEGREDEERRGHEQIQKTTDRFIAKVDELLKKKEGEILTI